MEAMQPGDMKGRSGDDAERHASADDADTHANRGGTRSGQAIQASQKPSWLLGLVRLRGKSPDDEAERVLAGGEVMQ
jgi:hypothetical protein